jgi:hypothetical protein
MLLDIVLKTAVLPLILAAVATAAWAGLARLAKLPARGAGGRGGMWGLAAGYLAGHTAILWPSFPPIDVTDRIPYLALAAALWVGFEAIWRNSDLPRWGGLAVLACLTLGMTLSPILLREDPIDRRTALWIAGLAGTVLVSWINLELLARHAGRAALAVPMVLVIVGGAAILVISGSAVLGQLSVILAMAWVASAGLALWFVDGVPLRNMVPVVATVLSALMVTGHVYANVPAWSAVVLAAAPAGAWSGKIGPARRLAPWQVVILDSVVTAALVALAVSLAWAAAPAPFDE